MNLSKITKFGSGQAYKAPLFGALIALAILITIPGVTFACSDGDCGGWDFGDVSYDGSSGGGWDFGDVAYDGSSGGGWGFGDVTYDGSSGDGWDFGEVSYDGSSGGGWEFGEVAYDGSTGGCCDPYSDPCCESGYYGDECCGSGYTECCFETGSSGERYYSSTPSYSSGGYSYGGGWSAPAPRSYSTPTYYSNPISVSSGHSYAHPVTYSQPAPHPVVTPVSNVSHVTHNISNVDNSIRDSFNTLNYNSGNVNSGNITMVPIAQPVAAYIPPVQAHPAPYCSISVTNTYGVGYYGGQQTLTWNSTNAHSASINPSVGSVSTSGSRSVSNMHGQVYTMTVWGPGGTATCQTQPVYVAQPTPYIPQVATPYVSLSQIPYTGFDYGPVGNAMYWVSLALVAFAGAYLMVYYKGGMLALAGSMIGGRGNEARSSRLAEFTPLPESAFAPVKKVEARAEVSKGYTGTTDAMSFIRSANGAPKIVINRA